MDEEKHCATKRSRGPPPETATAAVVPAFLSLNLSSRLSRLLPCWALSSSPLPFCSLTLLFNDRDDSKTNMSTTLPASSVPRSTLKPYLSLWHLLSLAPLAPPILALIFVAFRISDSTTDAQDRVADAKQALQASCLAAEHAATVGASLPRFLAERTNEQMTSAVRGTMEGARIALTLR
jgi:hypothetical protein